MALTATKPIPEPDANSEPFFDGARRGELMIQRCQDCGAHLPPGTTVCTECLSESLEWVNASGTGEVFSFGVMHQLYHEGFAAEIPYVVAVIELDEGPRLNSNIVGSDPATVRVGDRVAVVFDPVSDTVTLPKFRRTG
jgi:uncharacterized OB-fold protein